MKCDHKTSECSLYFCKKTGVCRKYFSNQNMQEKLSMRLRWLPIFENFTVGDILTSEEFRKYSGVRWVESVKKPKPEKTKPVYPPLVPSKNSTAWQQRRMKVYVENNGICWLCKEHVSIIDFSVDHVRPISKGGTNSFGNLRPAHKHCNSIKGNYPISSSQEFFEHIAKQRLINKKDSNMDKTRITQFEKAQLSHNIDNNPPKH